MANTYGDGGEGSGHGGYNRRAEEARVSIRSMLDQGSVESRRFYLARKTAWEMLKDRGYSVPDSELTRTLGSSVPILETNPTSIVSVFTFLCVLTLPKRVVSLYVCLDDEKMCEEKIPVVFMGTYDLRKSTICALRGQILNQSLSSLILVLQSKMNSFAQKELDGFPFKVEIFHIADLYVNITKHYLMPKHQVLSAEEKQNLLNKYDLEDDKQPPHRVKTDPIARYHGLEKGEVVKATYINVFHEQYRSVV